MRETVCVCPNCEGYVQVWNPDCCHVDGCHECRRSDGDTPDAEDADPCE